MPIYVTATFKQASATEFGDFDYTRSGNPTRTALQNAIADAEGAKHCLAYSTGMAALAAVVRLCKNGDEVLLSDDSRVRRADTSPTRIAAAPRPWIVRGRRVAAEPRPRRGYLLRRGAAAPRLGRG